MSKPEFSALIMAGGRSERMRATSGVHKALVEIDGKSLLQKNVETLLSEGFVDITVAVSAQESEIELAVSETCTPLVRLAKGRISCFRETVPLGTIGAARSIACAGKDLVVVNVDNLTTLPLRALAEHHHTTSAALTIACHYEPFRIPFGQLILEGTEAVEYLEKPAFPVMISSGVYVVGAKAAELIPKGCRFNITDLFQAVRERGLKVSAFQHESKWIDVNDAESLRRAEILFGADAV